ncbi:site-specific integrase [Natrarchaeobaculum sulfurireducens]|uniref:site-specific integrase n=1 Tax=Natrarchaeobaculum sulfurireducens TaxID=2044521 RepID=UPI00105AB098|nr:site-specific integrase [Natrarchaeobaculum sulfurireducens]
MVERDKNSFDSLDDAIESYLDELSGSVPDSTFWSQQTTITRFREEVSTLHSSEDCLESHQICTFINQVLENTTAEVSTICGWVNDLISLQAYIHHQDPTILKKRLLSELEESEILDGRVITEYLFKDTLGSDIQGYSERVLTLVAYLRQYQFGTRVHVYVELILDTCSQPGYVRDLELEDINLDNDTVVISIPETHLVSKAGLVTQRVANISPETSEALEEFIAYERKEPTEISDNPLLTTSHGRASESTLRREVKQASESAEEYPVVASPLTRHQTSCIVPSEIWQCSILQFLERQ